MALISVNGTAIKTPKTMKVSINDVDSSSTTRNALGDLVRDRVAVKHRIDLEFPPLKQTEISTLLTAVKDVFFSVTYQDPMDGVVTRTMYVGDRNSPMLKYGNGTTDLLWEGLSMSFIEK